MKRILIFLMLLLPCFLAAEIPDELCGIWEGQDRYVFFERNESGGNRIAIILKTYYGWYLDRVVEDASYAEKAQRDRNAATAKDAVSVVVDAKSVLNYEGVYEMTLSYSKHDVSYVPLCIIDGTVYLEFFLKSEKNPGFWLGNVVSEGIKASAQNGKDDFYSWYISESDNVFYRIRYWKTTMDYDPGLEAVIRLGGADGVSGGKNNAPNSAWGANGSEVANNEDGMPIFSANSGGAQGEVKITKHIFSANNVYTCVPGKRVYVRNLDKRSLPFDGRKMVYSGAQNVAAVDEPHLKQLVDKKTFDDMVEIIRVQNSKRKPDPKPLFPDMEVDFHWDLINLLEKDNEIIQNVRERQREFGKRAAD